jgi:hypothetical protein
VDIFSRAQQQILMVGTVLAATKIAATLSESRFSGLKD